MNEIDLRALVRDAVERHLGRRAPERVEAGHSASGAEPHPSHRVYLTLINTGDACVIEPSVSCTHCNYCKSHGH